MSLLRLELGKIKITDVQPGEVTNVENGTLYVNKQKIIDIVRIVIKNGAVGK